MNRKIGMIGSLVNLFTVICFALFMLIRFSFGFFFVCIFLSISFMCMIAAFDSECSQDRKAAGRAALIFSGVYATLIMIVYFTQCTTVHNENLSEDVSRLLNFSHMSWIFNLDLLGYGMMALSTFFAGLTINVKNKKDKALKIMLMLHGMFFPGCLIMPMTGMFVRNEVTSSSSGGGYIALEIWCLFFIPIGILSYMHFAAGNKQLKKLNESSFAD